MSVVLMNIMAYLALLALIGLAVILYMMFQNAMAIVRTGKGAVCLVDPPRDSIKGTINAVKGFASRYKARGISIAAYAKEAASSVGTVKDDVTTAYKSIKIDDVTDGARKTVDQVKQTAQAATFFAQIIETIQLAKAANAADK